MTTVDQLSILQAENIALREQVTALLAHQTSLQAQLEAALAHIAELEDRPKEPPAFVKANAPKREPKPPRRKRAPDHNRSRRLEAPTRVVEHALPHCPDCQRRLRGQSIARRRQVIELPEPAPVTITEHHLLKRYCWHCRRWHTPRLDLQGQVLGQRRFGVRLTSLIAYLRTTLRLPIGQIRTYLATMHQLRLSAGAIVELLHAAKQHGTDTLAALKAGIRASSVVHGDETGWREGGQNGYIWSFSTPGAQAIRFYTYDQSRSGQVARGVLGARFAGHLVTDFYAGYNQMPGPHQRCWAHLLRDLDKLTQQHGQDVRVRRWAVQVEATYRLARQRLRQEPALTPVQRQAFYARLVDRVTALGRDYARAKKHPCQALAKRLLRHQDELFQFVVVEEVSADNNLAERSLRPLVVGRKISGGSRSADGSETRMGLASLFGTWSARGLNPFEECLRLLSSKTPLPQL